MTMPATAPPASASASAPASASASPLRAFHRSNLLTYVSLAAGVGAIAVAMRGNGGAAGILIATSVVADTFDGRFARQFQRIAIQHDLGVQLDSLSDAIAFGIAPVVCLAARRPVAPGVASGVTSWEPAVLVIFWLCAIAYAACAITRLAAYNVTHVTDNQAAADFSGLPAPVAALTLATALAFAPGSAAAATLLILTASAMVLPLPIPRPRGVGLAAFTCWPLALIVWHLL
jgi:CDP-diacylglycerol--serine O-phosphatidyltransferase